MKSPGFFKPRETHTKAQSSFFFKIFNFYLLFLKSPPWNPLLADLIIVNFCFLNSLSPRGFVLFTVPSSKQPLLSGAKQVTYITHSWDFRPCHHRPPSPNTHNSLTPGFVTVVRSAGSSPVDLLWRTRPDTRTTNSIDENPRVWECWAEPSRLSVTNPSSVTDEHNEFIV